MSGIRQSSKNCLPCPSWIGPGLVLQQERGTRLALDLQELLVLGGSQVGLETPSWHVDHLSPTLSLCSRPPFSQEDPSLALPFTDQSQEPLLQPGERDPLSLLHLP